MMSARRKRTLNVSRMVGPEWVEEATAMKTEMQGETSKNRNLTLKVIGSSDEGGRDWAV